MAHGHHIHSLTCLARVSVTSRLCLGNVQCLKLSQHVRSSARQWWWAREDHLIKDLLVYRGPSRLRQLLPPLPLPIRRRRVHSPRNTSIPSLWPVPVRSLDHKGLQPPRIMILNQRSSKLSDIARASQGAASTTRAQSPRVPGRVSLAPMIPASWYNLSEA